MLRAGELTTLVVFEHITRQRDDVLNQAAKWEELGRAYCKQTTAAGTETVPAQQTTATAPLTLSTHWSPDLAGLTPQARAVIDGKPVGIKSVTNENGANRTLIIVCEVKA